MIHMTEVDSGGGDGHNSSSHRGASLSGRSAMTVWSPPEFDSFLRQPSRFLASVHKSLRNCRKNVEEEEKNESLFSKQRGLLGWPFLFSFVFSLFLSPLDAFILGRTAFLLICRGAKKELGRVRRSVDLFTHQHRRRSRAAPRVKSRRQRTWRREKSPSASHASFLQPATFLLLVPI